MQHRLLLQQRCVRLDCVRTDRETGVVRRAFGLGFWHPPTAVVSRSWPPLSNDGRCFSFALVPRLVPWRWCGGASPILTSIVDGCTGASDYCSRRSSSPPRRGVACALADAVLPKLPSPLTAVSSPVMSASCAGSKSRQRRRETSKPYMDCPGRRPPFTFTTAICWGPRSPLAPFKPRS